MKSFVIALIICLLVMPHSWASGTRCPFPPNIWRPESARQANRAISTLSVPISFLNETTAERLIPFRSDDPKSWTPRLSRRFTHRTTYFQVESPPVEYGKLAYQWETPDGKPILAGSLDITEPGFFLAGGESELRLFKIPRPSTPGTYHLQVTIDNENLRASRKKRDRDVDCLYFRECAEDNITIPKQL